MTDYLNHEIDVVDDALPLFCSLALSPRPSQKTEKKRPSFYTNPIAPHSQPQNGQVTIVMEELPSIPEQDAPYEEPEDEVQEVRVGLDKFCS